MAILPEAAMNILPFSAESMIQWNERADISQFLNALHAGTMYSSYGKYLFEEGKERTQALSQQFMDHAQKDFLSGRVYARTIDIPNFLEDAPFGRAAKYVIAWNGCVSDLLAESAFYSLTHIVESRAEIDCSLLLASHRYYKQATQVLRNFIEELILPIIFCENEQKFTEWRANKYKLRLRGDGGALENLVAKGILTSSIKKTVSDLYGEFNSFVHGNENRLNYKDSSTKSPHIGGMFNYDDFCEWSEYLSRSIDVGIRLLKTNYNQWEESLSSSKWEHLVQQGKMFCNVCHKEADFDVEPTFPAGTIFRKVYSDGMEEEVDVSSMFITYRCRQCGSKCFQGNVAE